MAKKIQMLPVQNIKLKTENMTLDLSLDRLEKQFQRAQYDLDSTIMTDMEVFMPKQDGTFVNATKAMSAAIAGSGRVVAAAPPFGRFLYYGKTMVDIETGSPFARPAAKKVLVSQFGGKTAAKENLDLSRGINPRAQAEWFEVAKKYYGKVWLRKAKKIAGGGQSG